MNRLCREDVEGIPFEVGDSAAGSGVAGVQEAEEVVKNIVPGFSEPDQPVDKSGKNFETLLENIEDVFHDVATTLNRTLYISSNRNVQVRSFFLTCFIARFIMATP